MRFLEKRFYKVLVVKMTNFFDNYPKTETRCEIYSLFKINYFFNRNYILSKKKNKFRSRKDKIFTTRRVFLIWINIVYHVVQKKRL